jgi:hypothetical protein
MSGVNKFLSNNILKCLDSKLFIFWEDIKKTAVRLKLLLSKPLHQRFFTFFYLRTHK